MEVWGTVRVGVASVSAPPHKTSWRVHEAAGRARYRATCTRGALARTVQCTGRNLLLVIHSYLERGSSANVPLPWAVNDSFEETDTRVP